MPADNSKTATKVKGRKVSYDPAARDRGLELIKNGTPIIHAAHIVGVPYTTLRNWSKCPRNIDPVGSPPKLSTNDEKQICTYINFMARAGNPVTPATAKIVASRIAAQRGIPFKAGVPSNCWWTRFKGRHPEIITKKRYQPDVNEILDTTILDDFFADFGSTQAGLGIDTEPGRLYNIGVSWLGTKKSQKAKKPHTQMLANNCSDFMTFTMCICGDGSILPSMVTYKGSLPNDKCHLSTAKDTLYTSSDSGHMDTSLYLQYLKHIEPQLNKSRPVMIIQDNLYGQDDMDIVQFCVEKQIQVVNLPPNSTHVLQPLDKIFHEVRLNLKKVQKTAGLIGLKTISKSIAPTFLQIAVGDLKSDSISSAYKQTGIYPVNRQVVRIEVAPASQDVQTTGNQTDQPVNNGTLMSSSATHEDNALAEQNHSVLDGECSREAQNSEEGHSASKRDASAQTDPIKTLPCSTCRRNPVELHPAVQAGLIDVEFAACLEPPETTRERELTEKDKERKRKAEAKKQEVIETKKQRLLQEEERKKMAQEREMAMMKVAPLPRPPVESMAYVARPDNVYQPCQYPKCDVCHTDIIIGLVVCTMCNATYHRHCTDLTEGDYVLICFKCNVQ